LGRVEGFIVFITVLGGAIVIFLIFSVKQGIWRK